MMILNCTYFKVSLLDYSQANTNVKLGDSRQMRKKSINIGPFKGFQNFFLSEISTLVTNKHMW